MKLQALVTLIALVGWVGTASAAHINSSGRCPFGSSCELGDANVTSIQLVTDGTGNAEIVLPAGSIATAEILADTIDFTNISDTLTLDADTGITVATGNEFTITAAAQVGIDEILTILVDQADDADATDVLQAIRIELASESGDANDTIRGIVMTVEEGTANTIIDAAISIDNEETTASTLTDAILITSSGVAAGVTDAVDASAANITNAINIGANLIAGTDDSLSVGATDDTVILDSNDSGGTYTCTDADANAQCTFTGGGTGATVLGSGTSTGVTIVSDGGTATIDGYVQAPMNVVALASGALTVNTVHLATAAADYDLPDACDSATGNWVTLTVQDDSETVSLTVTDTADTIVAPGLSLGADDELDSAGGATSNAEHVTVVCVATNLWYVTSIDGVWVDGGAAD